MDIIFEIANTIAVYQSERSDLIWGGISLIREAPALGRAMRKREKLVGKAGSA